MARTIEIFHEPGVLRGTRIARALVQGTRAVGIKPLVTRGDEYHGLFRADTVAFYGLHRNLRAVYDDVVMSQTKLLFFDLGYWGLGAYVDDSLRWSYHRVGLNDRHPNAYFRRRKHPNTRFFKLHRIPNFTRTSEERGGAILVVGMGRKVAAFHGISPGSWEMSVVQEIRQYTDRPIIYRPKLNTHALPPPIPGTIYSTERRIENDLERAWCVIVHQSNVAVDALFACVPVIVTSGGVAVELCPSDIALVNDPPIPDADIRRQFFYDLAYAQWTLNEMQDGTFWRHAIDEDLL